MPHWRALLLIYRRLNVELPASQGAARFQHELTEAEIANATRSFAALPELVERLSNQETSLCYDVRIVEGALTSLNGHVDHGLYPWLSDTWKELESVFASRTYDSVFVFWPQTDFTANARVPGEFWGLGAGPDESTNGATFAVVGNAPLSSWDTPVVGEVWLHEWLHGVCRIFEARGYTMPEHDADAGGRHGYIQSPTTGWTDFYRDLMTGQVLEGNERTGIPPEAWRGHSRI